mgnify:CR=1 FL=1
MPYNVWRLLYAASGADARARGRGHARAPPARAPLEVPPALEQHFFLREDDDVQRRLWAEHGIDGSWAQHKDNKRRRPADED